MQVGQDWDVLVIGAGIAGLAARERLLKNGFRVLTLEKARGYGGRLSTRRFGGDAVRDEARSEGARVADLGAQYASARDPEFRARLGSGAADGVREIRLAGDSTHPRWVHREGMSRLARLWLRDAAAPGAAAPIERSTRVEALVRAHDGPPGWLVRSRAIDGPGAGPAAGPASAALGAGGREWRARAVLLTAPVPQALELLGDNGFAVPELAEHARFLPCIAWVGSFAADSNLPSPGILKRPNDRIEGVFDQRRKGIDAAAGCVVVHASAALSLELYDRSDDELRDRIFAEAREWLPGPPLAPALIHRWRYCEPERPHPSPFLEPSATRGLWLAGDGFGERSSIEGAWRSGRAAADAIAARLAPRR